MTDITPKAVIAVSAFRDETMDMGIPFKIPAKGVKDHDKTGSEVHGFILFKKHTGNNAVYRMKKAVKEGAVIEEKAPELGINGKNAMPVGNKDKFCPMTLNGVTYKEKADAGEMLFAVCKENPLSQPIDVGRILRTFKIKKNVEVTDNGKIII